MRVRLFLLSMALASCGLVSGLDQIHVDDASVAPDASDAQSADAATNDAPPNAVIRCGPSTCSAPQICCITMSTSSGYQYACGTKDICPNGSIQLQCDDKSDCTDASAPVCCLSNGIAQCSVGAAGCIQLCNDGSQCPKGVCASSDAGPGLMRCQ